MTANDIDKVFEFCTNSFKALVDLAQLHLFLSVSVLVLLLAFSAAIFRPDPGTTSMRASESLQALLSVVTPTRSFWPSNYTVLARRASTSRSKTIQLPLSDICSDVLAGRIEFRDPKNDLSDLFREQVCVYGWLIRFHIGLTFWMNVLRWITTSYLTSMPVLSLTDLSLLSDTRAPNTKDTSYRPCCNDAKLVQFLDSPEEIVGSCSCSIASPLISMATTPVLCLDFLSYAHLEPFFRTLKASRQGDFNTVLEFTTLGPSIPFLSTPFILCAIPFLPRKYGQSQKSQSIVRTSSPLLITLHHVISLMMSTTLTVKTVSNISDEYSTKLDAVGTELETDRRVRNLFIDQWGLKGWREHRFLMAWEAGLLRAGYLNRWTVVVE